MRSVFTALVPALHIPWGHWRDTQSGDTWGGHQGGYSGYDNGGSGNDSWS